MSLVKKVLIVGGGLGGMACAIQMRRAGVEVDLIDIDPQWRVYGAGITITGPTLRALRSLGVLDEVKANGGFWSGGKVFDRAGVLIEELSIPALDEEIPGNGGILRPVLHKILSERTRAVGVTVRLGLTLQDLTQDGDSVQVWFSDDSHGSYDLVVGADGIFSKLRERIFPDGPKPKFTGQACWRLVADQPPGFDRSHFYMGGDMKLGFNPISPTQMYMFLLERTPDNPWIAPEDQPRRLYELMEGFGG
ncbi:MAG: FAD-dependent monooxygenase, partial [Caulobacteraceae bacterium]